MHFRMKCFIRFDKKQNRIPFLSYLCSKSLRNNIHWQNLENISGFLQPNYEEAHALIYYYYLCIH